MLGYRCCLSALKPNVVRSEQIDWQPYNNNLWQTTVAAVGTIELSNEMIQKHIRNRHNSKISFSILFIIENKIHSIFFASNEMKPSEKLNDKNCTNLRCCCCSQFIVNAHTMHSLVRISHTGTNTHKHIVWYQRNQMKWLGCVSLLPMICWCWWKSREENV